MPEQPDPNSPESAVGEDNEITVELPTANPESGETEKSIQAETYKLLDQVVQHLRGAAEIVDRAASAEDQYYDELERELARIMVEVRSLPDTSLSDLMSVQVAMAQRSLISLRMQDSDQKRSPSDLVGQRLIVAQNANDSFVAGPYDVSALIRHSAVLREAILGLETLSGSITDNSKGNRMRGIEIISELKAQLESINFRAPSPDFEPIIYRARSVESYAVGQYELVQRLQAERGVNLSRELQAVGSILDEAARLNS